jgi:hypothetical protein
MNNLDDHKQFVAEATKNGFKVSFYRGRNFYYGPSISGDNLQDLFRATSVNCTWDNLGLGYIMHPVKSDYSLESVKFMPDDEDD